MIDAAKLPNPYTPISQKVLDLSAPKIVDWMETKSARASDHMEQMAQRAAEEFASLRSVRVECYGGAHRSQAVAWKILQFMDTLSIVDVQLVCLDCEPLPELTPYMSIE